MSTPTKQAPPAPAKPVPAGTAPHAPVTPAKAAQAPVAPTAELDYIGAVSGSLSDGGSKLRGRERGTGVNPLDGTPVRDWVKASRTEGNKVKTWKGKASAAKAVIALLRRAVDEMDGVGLRTGKPIPVDGEPGMVTIDFKTADRTPLDMSPEAVKARADKRAANKAAKEASK